MRTAKNFLTGICLVLLFSGTASAAVFGFGAPKTRTNSIGMEFVEIPVGSFMRVVGRNASNELIKGKVTITKPFYMAKYEVTQDQWKAVMGSNPSHFKGQTNPVEMVSWDDVQEFIKRLNAKEGTSKYRLPTEAEWELAARGGTDTLFFFMKDGGTKDDAAVKLDAYAWFDKNSEKMTHPVGQKKPSPYGLYDIYGNVWEWVQDWYEKFPEAPEIRDPHGPEQGSERVLRGGSWHGDAGNSRSSSRSSSMPVKRIHIVGFRLAFSAE